MTATLAGIYAGILDEALRLRSGRPFRFSHTHKLRHKPDGSRCRTRYRRMVVSIAFDLQSHALEGPGRALKTTTRFGEPYRCRETSETPAGPLVALAGPDLFQVAVARS